MPRYRNIRVEPTEEAKAAVYSMAGYDGESTATTPGSAPARGQAVPLEDYDYGATTAAARAGGRRLALPRDAGGRLRLALTREPVVASTRADARADTQTAWLRP